MSCNCKVIKGPCAIAWNGTTFLSEGDVTIRANIESFDIMADFKGKLDTRLRSLAYTVAFKPVSTWATTEAVLSHVNLLDIGSDIFTASGSDLTLVITPLTDQGYTANDAGKIITFKKAALTGIPNLVLSTGAQMMDTMTFTCIRSTGTEQGSNESFWSVANWSSGAASTAISNASVTVPTILTMPWELTWDTNPSSPGATNPWYNCDAIEGWRVSFEYNLADVKTDNCGFIGSTLTNLSAKITGIPCVRTGNDTNPSASPGSYGFMEDAILGDPFFNDANSLGIGQSLAGLDPGHASYASLGGGSRQLRLAATDPIDGSFYKIVFNRAAITATGIRYGSNPLRQGEVEWTAYAGVGAELITELGT